MEAASNKLSSRDIEYLVNGLKCIDGGLKVSVVFLLRPGLSERSFDKISLVHLSEVVAGRFWLYHNFQGHDPVQRLLLIKALTRFIAGL